MTGLCIVGSYLAHNTSAIHPSLPSERVKESEDAESPPASTAVSLSWHEFERAVLPSTAEYLRADFAGLS